VDRRDAVQRRAVTTQFKRRGSLPDNHPEILEMFLAGGQLGEPVGGVDRHQRLRVIERQRRDVRLAQ